MVTVVSEMGEEIEPPPPGELLVGYSREEKSLETYVRKQVLEHETPTLEEIPEQSLYLPLEIPGQWDYMHVGPVNTNAPQRVDYVLWVLDYLIGPPTPDDPDDMIGISSDDDESTKARKRQGYEQGKYITEADMDFYFQQVGYAAPEYR